MTPNWIPDVNRFKLAGPPQWWLQRLYEFDPSLVVIPSRQDCLYRLGQRRKPRVSDAIVNDVLKEQADTQMLWSYGLIPVTTILATANWDNPLLFEELRQRAPWRMGGAEKVIKNIEDREWQAEIDKSAAINAQQDELGRDAWRLYRKKIGLTTHAFVAPRSRGRSDAPARQPGANTPLIKIVSS